jgi:hypothetical protein
MTVTVQIQAGESKEASSVGWARCTRELGGSVRWQIGIAVPADRDAFCRRLADLLQVGPATLSLLCQNKALGPAGFVTLVQGCQIKKASLCIEAVGTPYPTDAVETPRRRARQPATLCDLFEDFTHLAAIPSTVEHALQGVSLGKHPCVIQDGWPDAEFLQMLLGECWRLGQLRLLVSNSGTRWYAGWRNEADYRKVHDIKPRTLTLPTGSREQVPDFAAFAGVEQFPFEQPTFACGCRVYNHPVIAHKDSEAWMSVDPWLQREMPLFLDGKFVRRIVDEFERVNEQGDYTWRSLVDLLAAPTLPAPRPSCLGMPWVGTAVVQKVSTKNPWATVKLDGFEADYDTIDARISTPYSGADGKTGWHLLPGKRTKVLVAWPGRFDAPAVLLGNARLQLPKTKSPSLLLTEQLTVHLAGVAAETDVAIHATGQMNLKSDKPLRLTGEKAAAELSGQALHVGKPKSG